jgi:DNA adenine methylase Dam
MYLKSAFNYTGAKYAILDQILPYFPDNSEIDLFIDLFCGGGSVFMNTNYENIIANDIITPLIKFYKELGKCSTFDELKSKLDPYILDKTDKDAYYTARNEFNKTGNPFQFFCLIQSSMSNLMRFNKSGGFNSTYGKRTYNPQTEIKLKAYFNKNKELNVKYMNEEFDILLDNALLLDKKLFVYLDPPYFITNAGYNTTWNVENELKLYKYLDLLNDNGHKFMMSNVSIHKDIENPYLDKLKKYNIINIKHNYNKIAKNKGGKTQEIIVINY